MPNIFVKHGNWQVEINQWRNSPYVHFVWMAYRDGVPYHINTQKIDVRDNPDCANLWSDSGRDVVWDLQKVYDAVKSRERGVFDDYHRMVLDSLNANNILKMVRDTGEYHLVQHPDGGMNLFWMSECSARFEAWLHTLPDILMRMYALTPDIGAWQVGANKGGYPPADDEIDEDFIVYARPMLVKVKNKAGLVLAGKREGMDYVLVIGYSPDDGCWVSYCDHRDMRMFGTKVHYGSELAVIETMWECNPLKEAWQIIQEKPTHEMGGVK